MGPSSDDGWGRSAKGTTLFNVHGLVHGNGEGECVYGENVFGR